MAHSLRSFRDRLGRPTSSARDQRHTYAEATRTQRLGDFVGATVRGLHDFGAVPEILTPDRLRSAVSTPHRVDPDINATYAEMAQHDGTAVVPARPRKPKDKAKVEGGEDMGR